MSGQWATSRRRETLPGNWPKLRAQVKKRDRGLCVQCCGPGRQVDHVIRGAGDDLENLQLLCDPCHAVKSSAEGNAARVREKRPIERAPGLL